MDVRSSGSEWLILPQTDLHWSCIDERVPCAHVLDAKGCDKMPVFDQLGMRMGCFFPPFPVVVLSEAKQLMAAASYLV